MIILYVDTNYEKILLARLLEDGVFTMEFRSKETFVGLVFQIEIDGPKDEQRDVLNALAMEYDLVPMDEPILCDQDPNVSWN